MKRYDIFTPPYGKGYMEEVEEGKWVKFEDVEKMLADHGIVLNAELETLFCLDTVMKKCYTSQTE